MELRIILIFYGHQHHLVVKKQYFSEPVIFLLKQSPTQMWKLHLSASSPLCCHISHFFWGGAGTWFWQVPALSSSSLCCGIVSQKFDPLLLPPAEDPFTKCIAIHACAVGSWLWSLRASLTVSLSQDGGASTESCFKNWLRWGDHWMPGQVGALIVKVSSYSDCSC